MRQLLWRGSVVKLNLAKSCFADAVDVEHDIVNDENGAGMSRRLKISSLLCAADESSTDAPERTTSADSPSHVPMTMQPTLTRHRTPSENETFIVGGSATSQRHRDLHSPPLQRPYALYEPPVRSTLQQQNSSSSRMSPLSGQQQLAYNFEYTESAVRPSSSHTPYENESSTGRPVHSYVHPHALHQPQQSRLLTLNTSPNFSHVSQTRSAVPFSARSPAQSSPFSGLDVLVQAATEEMERLDGKQWRTSTAGAPHVSTSNVRDYENPRLSPVVQATHTSAGRSISPIMIRHPDSIPSPVMQAFPGFPTGSTSSSKQRDNANFTPHNDRHRAEGSSLIHFPPPVHPPVPPPHPHDTTYVFRQHHERMEERHIKRAPVDLELTRPAPAASPVFLTGPDPIPLPPQIEARLRAERSVEFDRSRVDHHSMPQLLPQSSPPQVHQREAIMTDPRLYQAQQPVPSPPSEPPARSLPTFMRPSERTSPTRPPLSHGSPPADRPQLIGPGLLPPSSQFDTTPVVARAPKSPRKSDPTASSTQLFSPKIERPKSADLHALPLPADVESRKPKSHILSTQGTSSPIINKPAELVSPRRGADVHRDEGKANSPTHDISERQEVTVRSATVIHSKPNSFSKASYEQTVDVPILHNSTKSASALEVHSNPSPEQHARCIDEQPFKATHAASPEQIKILLEPAPSQKANEVVSLQETMSSNFSRSRSREKVVLSVSSDVPQSGDMLPKTEASMKTGPDQAIAVDAHKALSPSTSKRSHSSHKSKRKSDEKRPDTSPGQRSNDKQDVIVKKKEPIHVTVPMPPRKRDEPKLEIDQGEQDAHDFLLHAFDRSEQNKGIQSANRQRPPMGSFDAAAKRQVIIKPDPLPEITQSSSSAAIHAPKKSEIEPLSSPWVAHEEEEEEEEEESADRDIEDALAAVMIEAEEDAQAHDRGSYPPSDTMDAMAASDGVSDFQADFDIDDLADGKPPMDDDMDVDQELLSLIEDLPDRTPQKQKKWAQRSANVMSSPFKGKRTYSPSVTGRSTPALSDNGLGSMLPPHVPSGKAHRKSSGSKTTKTSQSKSDSKLSKSKSHSATAFPSKSKGGKDSKAAGDSLGMRQTSMAASAADTSTPQPDPDDLFANMTITSSGRMIPKVKKQSIYATTKQPTAKSTVRAPSVSHTNSAASAAAAGRSTPFVAVPSPAPPGSSQAQAPTKNSSSSKRQKSHASASLEVGNESGKMRAKVARESIGPAEVPAVSVSTKEKELIGETNLSAGEEEEPEEDTTLYCICKRRYEEGRAMIACDRCDEWYHTDCVKMPDLEIDLVDQFICPPCVQRHPELNLHTTYKQRCFAGIKHPHPESAAACHKPCRGAFSKYCSDDCGIKYMQSKVLGWAKHGGNTQHLWDSVKGANPREGVVTKVDNFSATAAIILEAEKAYKGLANKAESEDTKPVLLTSKGDHELEKLQRRLNAIMSEREERKHEMEACIWRQQLLYLAAQRSDRHNDQCGWDQRLCFGDEEIAEFGDSVLLSYDGSVVNGVKLEHTPDDVNGDVEMDSVEQQIENEWWCKGKRKCSRHAGWQKLRQAELNYEREMKQSVLASLTTREREIRKRIEDVLYPQASSLNSSLLIGAGLSGPYKPMLIDSAMKKANV